MTFELVVEPALDGLPLALPGLGVAGQDGGPAALLEHRLGLGARRDAEGLGLGKVDRADAEVAAGVLGALIGERQGARDERVGPGRGRRR